MNRFELPDEHVPPFEMFWNAYEDLSFEICKNHGWIVEVRDEDGKPTKIKYSREIALDIYKKYFDNFKYTMLNVVEYHESIKKISQEFTDEIDNEILAKLKRIASEGESH